MLSPSSGFPSAIFGISQRRSSRAKDKPYKCEYPGCYSSFFHTPNLRAHETQKHGRKRKFKKNDYIGTQMEQNQQKSAGGQQGLAGSQGLGSPDGKNQGTPVSEGEASSEGTGDGQGGRQDV